MSTDFSNLSDEDFANLESPGTGDTAPTAEASDKEDREEQIHTNPEDELEDASSRGDGTLESVVQLPKTGEEAPSEEDGSDSDHTTPNHTKGNTGPDGEAAHAEGDGNEPQGDGEDPPSSSSPENKSKKEDEPETGSTEGKEPEAEVDYKAAYDQIMAPFKANGREIKIESPDEAVRLMQMGANYTKKMQTLQPSLRMMRMLENNDLLNEDRIGYLIDLHKKDPGAIQKLLKESNIDPMDLDTDKPTEYQPGNYKVSDTDMAFSNAVEELQSSDTGRELISDINSNWDLQSRQHLAKEPELLRIFAQQRDNGLYKQITDEMTRKRALGDLDPTVPFLTAYKRVGDALAEQGKLKGNATGSADPAPATSQQQPNAPMETRPAARQKAASKNGDAARAASPAPKSAVPAAPPIDPYEMSDEEIASMKSFKV